MAFDGWPRQRKKKALAAARETHAEAIARHALWQYWFDAPVADVRARAAELDIVGPGRRADLRRLRFGRHLGATSSSSTSTTTGQPDRDRRGAARLLLRDRPALGQPALPLEAARGHRLRLVDRSACGAPSSWSTSLRIDHFRGFEAFWEIPAERADRGQGALGARGPAQPLFDALRAALGELPIVAEDLGVITAGVEKLRDDNALPGMKVLQFAFAADASDPYLPHNYPANAWSTRAPTTTTPPPAGTRRRPRRSATWCAATWRATTRTSPWELWRLAQASVADTAIAPLQDLLGPGPEARMNVPGARLGQLGLALRVGRRCRIGWRPSCARWPSSTAAPSRGRRSTRRTASRRRAASRRREARAKRARAGRAGSGPEQHVLALER